MLLRPSSIPDSSGSRGCGICFLFSYITHQKQSCERRDVSRYSVLKWQNSRRPVNRSLGTTRPISFGPNLIYTASRRGKVNDRRIYCPTVKQCIEFPDP